MAIQLTGTPVEDDDWTVTLDVGGTSHTVTVAEDQTLAQIAAALAEDINNDANADFTAVGDGVFLVIVNRAGTAFVAALDDDATGTVDTTTNTTLVTFSGAPLTGELWSVELDDTTDQTTHTAPISVGKTRADALAELALNINSSAVAAFTAMSEGDILIIVNKDDVTFTATFAVVPTGIGDLDTATAEATTIALTGTPDEGEVYSVTLDALSDGIAESRHAVLIGGGETLAEVARALADDINATAAGDFTAGADGSTLIIVNRAGTAFSVDFDIAPGVVESSAAVVTTRADGINYYGLETLNIDLGEGDDVFNVQGTTARTNLNLHDGDERLYVSSTADFDLDTSTDFLRGHLHDVDGMLNIDVGAGRHLLMVSDEAATIGDPDVLITDQTPIAEARDATVPAADIYMFGPATGIITYVADADAHFAEGITIWTGFGNDVIAIDGTHLRDLLDGDDNPIRTVTTLNTGLGDDQVTVNLHETVVPEVQTITVDSAETSVELTLPDVLVSGVPATAIIDPNAPEVTIASTLEVEYKKVFGDIDLTVTRQEPDANTIILTVIFGGMPAGFDFAQMQPDVGIVATLVAGREADGFFVLNTQGPYDDFLATSDADIVLGAGSTLPLVVFGGQDDDTIETGFGEDIVFGDRGRVYYRDDAGVLVTILGNGGPGDKTDGVERLPIKLFTVDPTVGGDDGITTNDADDRVFGGINNDTINAGEGNNIILGDSGFIEYAIEPRGDVDPTTATSTTVLLSGVPVENEIWTLTLSDDVVSTDHTV
ncbi:MAG: hypothetical protein ACYS0D_14220, partial [Planctomycetota bacterium]